MYRLLIPHVYRLLIPVIPFGFWTGIRRDKGRTAARERSVDRRHKAVPGVSRFRTLMGVRTARDSQFHDAMTRIDLWFVIQMMMLSGMKVALGRT